MDGFQKELITLQKKYATLAIENWFSVSVFTWSWWFLVFGLILPWLIFIRYLDRNRVLHIWSFGLLVIIITTFIDDLGSELGLWIYPIKFIPLGLLAYPFDFSILPVAYMLVYQCTNTWKTFNISLFALAIIFAFIGEPISVRMGIVEYVNWDYIYSFVFYIFTGIIVRVIIQKWIDIQESRIVN
ncbi:CBO0543 family protein [Alkalihalobacillus sp. AL-G]|uniref:CBO0543 family protein n=1 Tax=Alkalihalobacillus sp. AL-G TaxID=2926399 RepID=UPI00272D8F30|nr:CBO0543 family protein [Alkalihalobacillus sp. AL-G]WLD92527.1 hypothetical protein MOJ78_16130 [Alkalihalobacillus sp. AL-G]